MRIAILAAMLFLSGSSALIFQTLWLRLSGLAFGNSVWSAALILSSFMAGLALGSAIAARTRIRRLQPLQLYAFLEITIALCGCAIVFVLPHVGHWFRPLYHLLWNHQTLLNALRFVASFLILLVPTTAMGLTLPVLTEDNELQRYEFGRAIGLLYGANTIGAVCGAICGEAFLVAAFGLLGTSVAAGLMNCAAAVIALVVGGIGREQTEPRVSERVLELSKAVGIPWRLCLVSFGCGAVILCLEVVWFRFLRLYVASSATAFSVMLAIVLAGIGVGGVLAGIVGRRTSQISRWLPVLLLLAGFVTLLCYLQFPVPALRSGEDSYYVESWRKIARLSFALMFPGALISGALFPLIVARVQREVADRMNSTGLTTLFNTMGAAVGPLLAGFVLLPTLGFQTTLIFCACTYLLLALVTINLRDALWRSLDGVALLLLLVCFGVTIITFPYGRANAHLRNARHAYDANGLQLVKVIEGTADTFQLLRRELFGSTYYYRLLTNAYSMSATNPLNQRYMRLSAYLPRVLRPEAKNALLICYGLGATADALLRGDQLEHVDIVDISKEVFELSPLHSDPNNPDPLLNKKATAIAQDGRFFLQASLGKYDVITGEPPPPKVAGSVNLYTAEFFSLLAGSLKDGGVASFWLPIYQLRVTEAKSILRAFHNAFPNASVWASSDYEWIMVGIKGTGERLDEEAFSRVWRDRETAGDLRRIGVESPAQAAALFVMDAEEIDRTIASVAPLTDLFPKRLSDAPPDAQATHEFAWPYIEASQALPRFRSSKLIDAIWPETLKHNLEPFFIARETGYLSRLQAPNRFAALDLYLRHSKLRTPVLEILDTDEFRVALAKQYAESTAATPVEALPDLIADALAARDLPRATQLLETAAERRSIDADQVLLLTYLYCVSGAVDKAEAFAASTASAIQSPDADRLWKTLQAEFGFHPPH